MKRRDLIQHATILFVAGTLLAVAGCHREKPVPPTTPPETPAPEPTETPLAEATPEEASPTPDAMPSEIAPAEPAAPYGELSENQQARVDAVMESLAEVNANETKRWVENLAYDESGSEAELRVWEAIGDAFKRWNEERPGINEASKQEAFNVLLAGSLVPIGDALRYVKLSALTPDDAKAVLGFYTAPAPPSISPTPDVTPSP